MYSNITAFFDNILVEQISNIYYTNRVLTEMSGLLYSKIPEEFPFYTIGSPEDNFRAFGFVKIKNFLKTSQTFPFFVL